MLCPLEGDFAGGRFEQADDQPSGGGLAAAAFPDKAKDLTLVEIEADIVNRANLGGDAAEQNAASNREELGQTTD